LATVKQCRDAVDTLVTALGDVDPVLRAKHVPRRSVACRLSDLDVTFVGRIDEFGVHDVSRSSDPEPEVDVRLSMDSDELVALANRTDDFLPAWLRGRIQVSASMRDLLRLRSLFAL
jgi:predicted lipid carrier protein YhbT